MTPEEINSLERKYKEYLPAAAAKSILGLIEYTRSLEKELVSLKGNETHNVVASQDDDDED